MEQAEETNLDESEEEIASRFIPENLAIELAELVRATKRKIDAETAEVEARNLPWFRTAAFWQTVVAGMIAAGLLVAWAIAYLQPILTRSSVEVDILKKKTELSQLNSQVQIFKAEEQLRKERDSLIVKVRNLQSAEEGQLALRRTLESELAGVSEAYSKLSQDYDSASAESSNFARKAEEWASKFEKLKSENNHLRNELRVTERSANSISAGLLAGEPIQLVAPFDSPTSILLRVDRIRSGAFRIFLEGRRLFEGNLADAELLHKRVDENGWVSGLWSIESMSPGAWLTMGKVSVEIDAELECSPSGESELFIYLSHGPSREKAWEGENQKKAEELLPARCSGAILMSKKIEVTVG